MIIYSSNVCACIPGIIKTVKLTAMMEITMSSTVLFLKNEKKKKNLLKTVF